METGSGPETAAPSRTSLTAGRLRSDTWLAWAVATLVMIAFGAPGLFLGRDGLAALFPDDAFYYFQIARNAASGRGLTFDGLHATNGFHPLWLLLLVPVFAIAPGDVLPLQAVVLIQAGLAATAAFVTFRLLGPRLGRAPALAAGLAIVALPGAPSVLRSGMESGLFLCLMVIIWRHGLEMSQREPPPRRGLFGLGLLCALAFLARLEAILLVPALLLLHPRWKADRRAAFAFLAPPALAATAYLVWNRLAFGTLLPISAVVKASQVGPLVSGARIKGLLDPPWLFHTLVCRQFGAVALLDCPPPALVLYLSLIALALTAGWRHRLVLREAVSRSGASFVLLASGLIVLVEKLSVPRLDSWYEAPIVLSAAIVLGSLVAPSPRLARLAVAAALFGALARLPISLWQLRDPKTHYSYYRVQAADWIRENARPGDRIGSWNAGMLGYFSHRAVVNLDGLVNDADYYRRVIQGRDLEGYMRDEQIGRLADQACGAWPRPTAYLKSTASPGFADQFVSEAHFFRADVANGCPGYAVWRWRGRGPNID